MPKYKKKKSASKKAVNEETKNQVVDRITRSRHKLNVNGIQHLTDKTNREESRQHNALKKPLKRLRNRKKIPKLKKFQCRVCRLDFLNQPAFLNHKKRFRGSKYCCIECDTEFSDKEQLGIHFEHTHMSVAIPGYTHKCHVCSQVFMHTAFLHAHLCHNHKQSWHTTKILSFGNITWDQNGQGQIIEYSVPSPGKATNEKFNQFETSVSFDSYGCVESEIVTVKNEIVDEEITTCRKYQNNSSMKLENKNSKFNKDDAHFKAKYACKPCYVLVRKLSENMIPPFVCKLCDMIFSTEELKRNHIAGAHTFVESAICDKRLPTESWMRRHFRDDHSIGFDDNETCACGKNMHVSEALEEHFFQHSMRTYISALKPLTVAFKCRPSEKTEVCNNCGKLFWLKTCLEIHKRGCSETIGDSSDPVTLQIISRRKNHQESIALNEFVCHICCAQFPTQMTLLNHVRFYARAKKYRCHICGAFFNGKSLLNTHTRDAHTFHIAYYYSCYCTICDQGFTKKIFRRIHIAHVHGEKYPSKMTNKAMVGDGRVCDTALEHDGDDRKCLICNLQFVSRKRFIEHTNYFKNEEIITCRICGQLFEGQYNAHRHYKLCHYPADIQEAYQHKCPICKEAFAFKIHLTAHGKHVHKKNIHGINLMRKRNNEKLGDCSTELSTSGVARYHMCAICEVSFPNLDFLTAHQMEYEMDGKYVCPRCGRRCGTSTLLLDHLSLNHSTAINDSIKCRRCDEFFLTPAIWLSHIKHCHMSNAIQPPELFLESHINFPNKFEVTKLKSSPVCNKIFGVTMNSQVANQSNRNSREKALVYSEKDKSKTAEFTSENDGVEQVEFDVTEEMIKIECGQKICSNNILRTGKKWQCRICGIDCLRADELAKHNARYANEGPYKCKICTRRFESMKVCQAHELTHYSRNVKTAYYCEVCYESFDELTAMKAHSAHFHDMNSRTIQAESCLDEPSDPRNPICLSQSNSVMMCSNGSNCAVKYLNPANQSVQLSPNDRLIALDRLDTNLSVKHVKICPTKSPITSAEGERFPDQIPMCITGMNSIAFPSVGIPEEMAEEPTAQSANKFFIRQSLFRCEVCGSVFNSKSSLESHRDNFHRITTKATEKNSLVVLTEINDINVMNPMTIGHLIPLSIEPSSQKDHNASDEDTSKSISRPCDCSSRSQLRCEPCDFIFPTLKMLQLHKNWVHSTSFPNIECTDVSNLNSSTPVPSTVQDSVRNRQLFVNNLPIIQGPQALGINVEQQQSKIIIQTVSIPIAMGEPNMIMHVTGESPSYVQDNTIESSVRSDAFDNNISKESTCSLPKVMDNLENKSVVKRKECSADKCKVALKKIKPEPVD